MPRKRSAERLIEVAVWAALRHPLTYCLPQGIRALPGQRVQVPLGTRRVAGIVLEPRARPVPGIKLREITRVLDPEPLLSPELVVLGRWIADYYLAPVGDVFRAMLPLRPEARRTQVLNITEAGERKLAELESSLLDEARHSTEAQLLHFLRENPGAFLGRVRRKFSSSQSVLERLQAKKWVEESEIERLRGRRSTWVVSLASGPVPDRSRLRLSPASERLLQALSQRDFEDHRHLLKSTRAQLADLRKLDRTGLIELRESGRMRSGSGFRHLAEEAFGVESPPALTAAQSSVLEDLTSRLGSGKFSAVLLQGVTASGKTEIYLRLIARCLELDRTALMLVPEIALTPAVLAYFESRFGNRVAVFHSGLSETERHEAWWRVRRGEAPAVLGTRSAVFAPLLNLGVVIIDEEHDPSYKQQETPRYQGRDVAVMRARLEGALAVLGSATPSLESSFNAREGKYHLAKLDERIGGRPLASVEIIDMRQEFRETLSQVPISRRLREAIESQLRAGMQTMILLNRRGYSWFLLCRSCGETERCLNCSISLTYHRRERQLICHYCGYTAAVPARCRSCGSEYLHYVGEGTEKMEAKLSEMFPGSRVARLDRDIGLRPEQYARILADFRSGKIDILVGTQLIAKGHDFPGVTLVGVVSVDTGLSLPDFRAAERTFQLLTQAAGRSGRGDMPGRVLLQTFYPQHYAVQRAAEQNYEGFYSKEIPFRRIMHYPPCAALANVIVRDPSLERAAHIAQDVGTFLGNLASEARALKVLGPSPAPLAKIEGRYRIQFLLKSSSRAQLNGVLRRLLDYCEQRGISMRSIMIDVDPISLM
jgi:primosomal protein N' (replication factor Y)